MEKEFLTQIRRSVTLNVTGGKIDSFREKEETTGTVRAYDNGCIGIAGCLGEPDEQRLTEKAAEALEKGMRQELMDLGFAHGDFSVLLQPASGISPLGAGRAGKDRPA